MGYGVKLVYYGSHRCYVCNKIKHTHTHTHIYIYGTRTRIISNLKPANIHSSVRFVIKTGKTSSLIKNVFNNTFKISNSEMRETLK